MKKLNKLVAILVAMAMVLSLSIIAAFADDPDPRVGAADNSYITKYLKLPSGVTIPDKTFTFTVTPKSTGAPAVKADADLDLNTLKAGDMRQSASTVDGSSLVGNLKIADWFDVTAFPAAGKYTYEVEEYVTDAIKNNEYKETIGDSADEVLVYSQAKYTIDIYVTNNSDGTKAIDKIVASDGTNKVDVTDTDPTDNHTQDDVNDANAEGATFVNEYQNLGNTPGDPGEIDPSKDDFGDLGIQKQVTGTYGDYNAPFKFKVTVTKPATGYPVDQVEAYVYTGSTKAANPTMFTFGEEQEITLKSGQTLAFANLPTGATYSVTENLAGMTAVTPADYKASYVTKTQTADAAEATTSEAVVATAAGDSLELAAANKKAIDNTDKINTVIYTNDSQIDDTPTGILISNLPYIALALVAIGGLVAYVVVRRRQDDEA